MFPILNSPPSSLPISILNVNGYDSLPFSKSYSVHNPWQSVSMIARFLRNAKDLSTSGPHSSFTDWPLLRVDSKNLCFGSFPRNSVADQWLGLHAIIAEVPDSIPS